MAVYSRKDFENYINKDKIKKQKIKKRTIIGASCTCVVVLLIGLISLFFVDKSNFIKEDNYTAAINTAIQKFANEKVTSHDAYPRLSYNYLSSSPRPTSPVEEDEDKDIYIDYSKEDKEDKIENKEDNTLEEDNTNNTEEITAPTKPRPTTSNIEENEDGEEEEKSYEYDYFIEVAGKGNYPGYNIMGGSFIQDIRKELCLAIKAYTSLPLASGEGNYKLDYKDSQYDYVYFFLVGEVKKVDKTYLKQLDGNAGQNTYDVYSFWISLTENKSSKIAANLLNGDKPTYSVIITDFDDKALSDVKVSFISGSYAESINGKENAILIFQDVPFGSAKLKIEKEGFINFPNEIAYKEYETINISNEEYKGKYVSGPLRVKLQESSLAQCSFSFTSYEYEFGKDGRTVKEEKLKGNYTMALTNTDTKEKFETIIPFEEKDVYLCHYFDRIPKGIYDIEVYPSQDKLGALFIEDAYINEYGINEGEYLTQTEKFVFSFNADKKVTLSIEAKDSTSHGLIKPNEDLSIYQFIKTNAIAEDIIAELKVVDCKSGKSNVQTLKYKDGKLDGKIEVSQNKAYDIYLSTVFGDILLYKNFSVKNSDCAFKVDVKDNMLPKCLTDIYIKRSDDVNIRIEHAFNEDVKFAFLNHQSDANRFSFKKETPIESGYYYIYIYTKDNVLKETYVVLISEKSNNYTLTFDIN